MSTTASAEFVPALSVRWESKQRTTAELFRILKPGAELHIADWGSPTSLIMRALFVPIQLLDGFRKTQDNVAGTLLPLFEGAGFRDVAVRRTFRTMFGTLALIRAIKPAEPLVT